MMEMVVHRILASRGMSGAGSSLDSGDWTGLSEKEVIDALLYCQDESDLRARL